MVLLNLCTFQKNSEPEICSQSTSENSQKLELFNQYHPEEIAQLYLHILLILIVQLLSAEIKLCSYILQVALLVTFSRIGLIYVCNSFAALILCYSSTSLAWCYGTIQSMLFVH
jgi:hypothetical protein